MSFVFEEGRFELTFDDRWSRVVRWDGERAYRDGIGTLRTTRAVDFCGIQEGGERPALYLIELTDLRDYRIETKRQLSGRAVPPCEACGHFKPNLYEEVALKVRDTVAGLAAAAHVRQTESESWRPIADTLACWDQQVRVMLWLELEEDQNPEPARPNAIIDRLKKELRWLTARVMVVNSKRPPPGVAVRHLPRVDTA